jgi:hypothetical protein
MSVFEKTDQPFQVMGQSFTYRFIPSIHFQSLMSQATEAALSLRLLGEDAFAQGGELGKILDIVRNLLQGKVYEILRDVLQYQNQHRADLPTLQNTTSPLEIAQFINLLLTDEEVHQAIEVILQGVGKLVDKMNHLTLSPTANSTPLPSANSDSNPSTSTESLAASNSEA